MDSFKISVLTINLAGYYKEFVSYYICSMFSSLNEPWGLIF